MTQVAPRTAGSPSAAEASSLERRIGIPLLVEWAVAAILGVTLAAYMLLGNFTRYVSDDFGTTLAVRLRGFWAQSIAEYQTHDGHFLATALQDAGGMLNDAFARVLPGILIAAWVVLLTLALRHLVPAAGLLGRLLIAAGIVYTTLRVTPSPFLAMYWMTASLAYVVPLLLAAVLVWLVSRPSGHGWRHAAIIAVVCLVAFLAAGEEEAYTAAQTVALTLALAVAVSRLSAAWQQKLPVLAAAWVGSVAGLGVMAASPGNAIRSTAIAGIVGRRPSLLRLPGFTFPAMLDFFQTLVGAHWRGLLAMAILAALIGARAGAMTMFATTSAVIAVALAAVGVTAVVFSALAPAGLVEAGLPAAYGQIVPVYISVCAAATLGWVGGRICRALADRAWRGTDSITRVRGVIVATASLLAGAAVIAGPVATLASIKHDLPAIQAYADTKDAQAVAAKAAHAAGRTSVIVPAVTNPESMGVFSHGQELSSDPSYYINRDEAAYYGIVTMILPRR